MFSDMLGDLTLFEAPPGCFTAVSFSIGAGEHLICAHRSLQEMPTGWQVPRAVRTYHGRYVSYLTVATGKYTFPLISQACLHHVFVAGFFQARSNISTYCPGPAAKPA